MAYTKVNWANGEAGGSKMNATNFGNMDNGIAAIDSAVGDLSNLGTTEKSNLVGAINEVIPPAKLNSSQITNVTPINGSNYAMYGNTYYYKTGSRVHVHIGIALTATSSTQIFSLPDGYRPKTMLGFVGLGSTLDSFSGIQINANGSVHVLPKNGYALADLEFDVFEEEE